MGTELIAPPTRWMAPIAKTTTKKRTSAYSTLAVAESDRRRRFVAIARHRPDEKSPLDVPLGFRTTCHSPPDVTNGNRSLVVSLTCHGEESSSSVLSLTHFASTLSIIGTTTNAVPLLRHYADPLRNYHHQGDDPASELGLTLHSMSGHCKKPGRTSPAHGIKVPIQFIACLAKSFSHRILFDKQNILLIIGPQ